MYPRNTEALERRREREQREDAAPRLATEVPGLRSLRLVISYARGAVEVQPGHTRVVVVPRAPALFHATCGVKECKAGSHDFTADVMKSLRAGERTFRGVNTCPACGCELRYEAEATYG